MPGITIISASVRQERNSHRVALYFNNYLEENNIACGGIIDLKEYDFPIFQDTLKMQKNPAKGLVDFAQKIESARGIIIVTPEYNGSFPASLKNAIDVLYDEWKHKPIAIATVSSGPFGGSQVLLAVQFTLWKIKAQTVPAMFPVSNVQKAYDEKGNPTDKATTDDLAGAFIKELQRCMETVEGTTAPVL